MRSPYVKWKPEPWFFISHAEYELQSGETINFGQPFGYYDAGSETQNTNNDNKIQLKEYDDDTMVEATPGVSIEYLASYDAYTGTSDIDAGAGGFNREIQVLHQGHVPMVYLYGTSPLAYGSKLSPYKSGCAEWASGQYYLGHVAQAWAQTGTVIWVKVQPEKDEL